MSSDKVHSIKHVLCVQALKILLQKVDNILFADVFPGSNVQSEWQLAFLGFLSKKNAISVFPMPGADGGIRIRVKNRHFIQTLLDDSKSDGQRLGAILESSEDASNQVPAPKPMPLPVPLITLDDEGNTVLTEPEPKPKTWLEEAETWDERVLEYIVGKSEVTTGDILVHALGMKLSEIHNAMKKRVGAILRGEGWAPVKSDGRTTWTKMERALEIQDPPLEGALEDGKVEPADLSPDALEILRSMQQLLVYSVDLQNKIAENLLYIRERGDDMSSSIGLLSKRVKSLEENATRPSDAPVNSSIAEVKGLVETLKKTEEDKMTYITTSIGKLSQGVKDLQMEAIRLLAEDSDE